MIDLSPEALAAIMLTGVLIAILSGYPIGLSIGALTAIVGLLVFGPSVVDLVYDRIYRIMLNYTILAVPLFVFMGTMLERSGIAERLYDALYLWMGGLRGGLAIVTVLIGTILAACVGIIAASITMLTLVALPSMIKRGYDKSLATGSIIAGGCLGILIPPSIMLVVYGPMANISVGKLFFGAFMPGFALSAIYCIVIAVRSFLRPEVAPTIPAEERTIPFWRKTWMLMTSLLPTALLIVSVLGVIFFGVAPPTEAASMGALVSILLALAYRRLNLQVLKEVTSVTFRVSGFILLIVAAATAFVGVFIGEVVVRS